MIGSEEAADGVVWTATLTPRFTTEDPTNLITLNNTGISDVAGNTGIGTTTSNNYVINTRGLTYQIAMDDTALTVGETSLVTITFNEAVLGFTNANLEFGNGTLTDVTSADGVDTLNAVGPRNVMIGSWTDHEENLVALRAIRAEWASTRTLDERIDHIIGRVFGGLNGSFTFYSDFVGPGTVHNDNVSDLFRNVHASDWRFLFSGDALTSLIGRINHLV